MAPIDPTGLPADAHALRFASAAPEPNKPAPAHPVPKSAIQIGKIFAYFTLLIFGALILEEILQEISKTQYAQELSRVSGMAASILDANKNIDDLIVTMFALSITFLLILPVSWVHMITKGDDSEPSLTQTLIVLSVIVAGVMLMLEDNLARAFGLVGVVAAVRYRNTLKDPKDAVFVFLSLGIGMACGFQSYHVALVLSLFECAILLVLWLYQAGGPRAHHSAAGEEPRLEAEVDESRKDKKEPNAILTVQTTSAAAARQSITAVMEQQRGNWRLVRTEERPDGTTLEFLGRQSRKSPPPVNYLEQLRKADPAVRLVAFRSLRTSDDSNHASPT
ncbi:MAG: hypothetical protein H6Q89_1289 [Myxococcaceae bacterium]|nr:hypothetical protein [Myxococcaceae bacterium]